MPLGPDDHRAAIESRDPAVRARLSSVGRPLPGIELEIRGPGGEALGPGQSGRICVRGGQVSAEYAGLGRETHLRYLASPEWAAAVRDDLLPWVLGPEDLGDDCLEVGPGPGVTTDLLRARARRLTAVELDTALAETLADRLAGTNVDVVNADATNMPFATDRFGSGA